LKVQFVNVERSTSYMLRQSHRSAYLTGLSSFWFYVIVYVYNAVHRKGVPCNYNQICTYTSTRYNKCDSTFPVLHEMLLNENNINSNRYTHVCGWKTYTVCNFVNRPFMIHCYTLHRYTVTYVIFMCGVIVGRMRMYTFP
jgi:hypothetical protein